ncbi:12440_t:CDS:1 [Funneliformis caledonium]|uniref:12440_t:CDS:1 n=1 Tax=Funneliformis caledonium TaxID=1117310 RepID=A0A9N9EKZ0_9GLOM|nr:12440_t:CDS:1 [Funneliformis caledonium]
MSASAGVSLIYSFHCICPLQAFYIRCSNCKRRFRIVLVAVWNCYPFRNLVQITGRTLKMLKGFSGEYVSELLDANWEKEGKEAILSAASLLKFHVKDPDANQNIDLDENFLETNTNICIKIWNQQEESNHRSATR